jgi:hypothetical protein
MAAKENSPKAIDKAKKITTGNIFSEGVLITLRTRCWGATGRLESNMFEVNDDTIDKREIHASMTLLKDTRLIDAMRQTREGARRYIKAHSIYFPDSSFDFIPKDQIEEVCETLDRYRERFFEYGEDLIATLKDLEKQFAEAHPNLYNPAKYPSEGRLRSILVFKYVLRVFSAPDKELGVISPKMYKREMAKWREDIESMKKATADVVCKNLIDRIDALKEGCETGKISQGTINSINGVLEKFDTLWRGFVDSGDVRKMIDDVKLYMEGTDAEMIRYDDNFRRIVANKAAKIAGELENKGFSVKTRSLDI